MSRRLGLLGVLALGVLVGGTTAAVLGARPDLRDARDRVDARWVALRAPLARRYQALGQVVSALQAAGVADRSYTVDLADAVGAWQRLAGRPTADARAEAEVANRLEGLAARTRANVRASARLRGDAGLAGAFDAFDQALVPPPAVRAYNRAARAYEGTRDALWRRLPAELLGYGTRPALVVGRASG